jgi:small-conductance mechanosensitive channel
VSIGYDVAWRQVHAMLQEAARRTHGVLARPEPRVLQVALSDFYIEYRLVAHSDPADPTKRAEAHSRLHENILDVFNENGVQILSPHYFSDPDHEKVVPKARWYEAPAKKPD